MQPGIPIRGHPSAANQRYEFVRHVSRDAVLADQCAIEYGGVRYMHVAGCLNVGQMQKLLLHVQKRFRSYRLYCVAAGGGETIDDGNDGNVWLQLAGVAPDAGNSGVTRAPGVTVGLWFMRNSGGGGGGQMVGDGGLGECERRALRKSNGTKCELMRCVVWLIAVKIDINDYETFRFGCNANQRMDWIASEAFVYFEQEHLERGWPHSMQQQPTKLSVVLEEDEEEEGGRSQLP